VTAIADVAMPSEAIMLANAVRIFFFIFPPKIQSFFWI
jgi:hypothetical protein